MTLLGLILTLIVVGILLYLVNAIIPMEAGMKRLLNILVVVVFSIVTVVWLLGFLGVDIHKALGVGEVTNVKHCP